MKQVLLVVAICTLAAVPAGADLIVNGSFEYGRNPGSHITLPEGSADIAGWTVIGSGVTIASDTIDYIGSTWTASDGRRSLDLNGNYGTGGVQQTFSTTPGTSYVVSFDMAGNPVGVPTIKTMDVLAVGTTTQSQSYSFDITGKTCSAMGWLPMEFTFVADAPLTTLQFLSTVTGPANAWGPALDNVGVSVVPVPGAVLLAMLGLSVAGARLRRRR